MGGQSRDSLVVKAVVIVYILHAHTVQGGEPQEFCHADKFQAICPQDSVVVVEEAMYGRMAMNKCVQRDFGHLGCGQMVTDRMHRLCSGRHDCQFNTNKLHGSHGCPDDLTAYLRASYKCQPVVTCERPSCAASDALRVTDTHGYLASVVTMDTGCGSPDCPWIIETKPGQMVNITLMNYYAARGPPYERVQQPPTVADKICYRYASVRVNNQVIKDLTVCNYDNGQIEQNVIATTGNTVEITLFTFGNEPQDAPYFALHYQVIGCPDIPTPRYATVSRDGDSMTVTCNFTSTSWTLTCAESAWVGQIGHCAAGSKVVDKKPENGKDEATYGMLIIIGLGVAIGIIIGLLMLAVTLVYLRKRTRSSRGHHEILDENAINHQMVRCDPLTSELMKHPDGIYSQASDYLCTIHMKQQHNPGHPGHHLPMTTLSSTAATPGAGDGCEVEQHPGKHATLGHHQGVDPGGCIAVHPPVVMTKREGHMYELPRYPYPDMCPRTVRVQSSDNMLACEGGDACDPGEVPRTT